jgi:hypothetical protein
MGKPSTDETTRDTLFDAAKPFSPTGRAKLLSCLRATAIQLPPQDGETMARIADILQLLPG